VLGESYHKTDNLLELIDEVDKIGRINGDAASALKMVDPEQNNGFFSLVGKFLLFT
jgi:ATP-dependent Lon protease